MDPVVGTFCVVLCLLLFYLLYTRRSRLLAPVNPNLPFRKKRRVDNDHCRCPADWEALRRKMEEMDNVFTEHLGRTGFENVYLCREVASLNGLVAALCHHVYQSGELARPHEHNSTHPTSLPPEHHSTPPRSPTPSTDSSTSTASELQQEIARRHTQLVYKINSQTQRPVPSACSPSHSDAVYKGLPPSFQVAIQQLDRMYVDLAGTASDLSDIIAHHSPEVRAPNVDNAALIQKWNQKVFFLQQARSTELSYYNQ